MDSEMPSHVGPYEAGAAPTSVADIRDEVVLMHRAKNNLGIGDQSLVRCRCLRAARLGCRGRVFSG